MANQGPGWNGAAQQAQIARMPPPPQAFAAALPPADQGGGGGAYTPSQQQPAFPQQYQPVPGPGDDRRNYLAQLLAQRQPLQPPLGAAGGGAPGTAPPPAPVGYTTDPHAKRQAFMQPGYAGPVLSRTGGAVATGRDARSSALQAGVEMGGGGGDFSSEWERLRQQEEAARARMPR